MHVFIFKYYIILKFLRRLVFLLNTYVIKCINDYIYFAVIKLFRLNDINVSYKGLITY